MVKKIVGSMIGLLLLFSLVSCNKSKENEMIISFELSNKTTNYFDTDERETLLQIVNSLDDLTQLLEENEFMISPMYEESFFDYEALVLYGLSYPKELQYSIDKITIEGTKLFLHQMLDTPNDAIGALIGAGVVKSSFFLIEVNKVDISEVVELVIKTRTISGVSPKEEVIMQERAMKTYLEEILKKRNLEATIDDVSFFQSKYLGIYDGSLVGVFYGGQYHGNFSDVEESVEITGLTYAWSQGYPILVWKDDEIYGLVEAFEKNFLTEINLIMIHELYNREV